MSLFTVHVESPIMVVLCCFIHDVLVGSFSDMIFYLSMWHFSRECVLHILCWCVLCFRYETSFAYISWSLWPDLSWRILSLFDLGSRDRPREFETVTHVTFWLERYYIHIRTLTLLTWWPTHFEPDMTPPLGTITRLYYPCSPYHTTVPLPFLSIISLIWLGRVRDG